LSHAVLGCYHKTRAVFSEVLLSHNALSGGDECAIEALQLGQRADDKGAVLFEFSAGVPCQVHLLELVVDFERLY